jgi:drug/metabolite transporter (DMT)-like permease
MGEEKNGFLVIMALLRYFAVIFTMTILAISLAGILSARHAPITQEVPTLYISGGAGLYCNTILQLAGFAFILAAFVALLFSDRFFSGVHFPVRILLLLLATLVIFSIFSIIFKWFPTDDPKAWLAFVLSAVVCSAISFGLTLLKFKMEGKKYDRLLANYKARHKNVN